MTAAQFINYIKYEKRYSLHTVKAYQKDLDQFFSYLKIQYEISKIQDVDHHIIRSWIIELIELGNSNRSVNRKISTLKSFYRYLLKKGHIRQNPMKLIISPKTSSKLPRFIEKDPINNFLDQEPPPNDVKAFRNLCIIELLYITGIRVSELISLKERDLDLHACQIKVLGKRNKERIIPFNKMFSNRLNAYLKMKHRIHDGQGTNTYLFTTDKEQKLYPKLVYRIVNKFLSSSTTLEKKSPHILRHTFATHMLNNGADLNAIKEILGHANLSATQVYTHNTLGQLKSIHNDSHPREKIMEE